MLDRQAVVKAYETKSAYVIAKSLAVHVSTIYRILGICGVKKRPRGGSTRAGKTRYSIHECDVVAALYRGTSSVRGLSMSQIAARMNMSRKSVSNILHGRKERIRPKGPRFFPRCRDCHRIVMDGRARCGLHWKVNRAELSAGYKAEKRATGGVSSRVHTEPRP